MLDPATALSEFCTVVSVAIRNDLSALNLAKFVSNYWMILAGGDIFSLTAMFSVHTTVRHCWLAMVRHLKKGIQAFKTFTLLTKRPGTTAFALGQHNGRNLRVVE